VIGGDQDVLPTTTKTKEMALALVVRPNRGSDCVPDLVGTQVRVSLSNNTLATDWYSAATVSDFHGNNMT
jgi:hypothetical protein